VENFQFEEGNSCCQNVTSLGKYFGHFGINRQQLRKRIAKLHECRPQTINRHALPEKIYVILI